MKLSTNEYSVYHDEEKGYVLVGTSGEILIDVPIDETQENTQKFRKDVKHFLKERNQSIVVQDSLDESRIKFENGEVVGGYSRYEGHDKEVLELWGFNLATNGR